MIAPSLLKTTSYNVTNRHVWLLAILRGKKAGKLTVILHSAICCSDKLCLIESSEGGLPSDGDPKHTHVAKKLRGTWLIHAL